MWQKGTLAKYALLYLQQYQTDKNDGRFPFHVEIRCTTWNVTHSTNYSNIGIVNNNNNEDGYAFLPFSA